MELLPIGPVLFIDTAGIDDVGALGDQRIEKTRSVFERTEVGIIVTESGEWGAFEDEILAALSSRDIPVIAVFNKADIKHPPHDIVRNLEERNIQCQVTDLVNNTGVLDVRQALIRVAPDEFINPPSILGDLVPAGELAVLVVPIDKEAPRGRLIAPQVQSIRDILDNDAYCMVVKERELRDALMRLNRPPAIVITDSQAFLKVSGDTPDDILMTSFSILFARFKGDLDEYVRGALAIDSLSSGDKILVAEACTHHPIGDDIGRVKIPRWLTQYVGGKLDFHTLQGHDLPDDLNTYKLVIHCGSCMFNRREALSRIARCRSAGVPVTNYGLAIAFSLGIFERALRPFPSASEVFRKKG